MDAWCPFLRKVDLLDDAQLAECLIPVKRCDAATAAGDWQGAINAWGDAEGAIDGLYVRRLPHLRALQPRPPKTQTLALTLHPLNPNQKP